MAVAADDRHARTDEAVFRQHDMLDAPAPDLEVMHDVLLFGEIAHHRREGGGRDILIWGEMTRYQRDLLRVPHFGRALDLAKLGDGDSGGKFVGHHEIEVDRNDIAWRNVCFAGMRG